MRRLCGILLWMAACIVLPGVPVQAGDSSQAIRIGSKTFPESYILAEIAAQLLQSHGFAVERQLGLGGTLIAFEALQTGSIDLYPEYTGTLSQAVLRQPGMTAQQLHAALATRDLAMAKP